MNGLEETIVTNSFAIVFGLATIGLDGFSMVAIAIGHSHWSNDGMVTIHRYGLVLVYPCNKYCQCQLCCKSEQVDALPWVCINRQLYTLTCLFINLRCHEMFGQKYCKGTSNAVQL